MAAAEAAPTPTAAPTPFPAGDPRNGKYFETLAALEHQLNNTLTSDNQALADAKANFNYSAGTLDRQLPLSIQTARNAANTQGLAESGALVKNTGTLETRYAAQRGKLTSGLQAETNRVNQAENSARETFNLGRTKAAETAREEALAAALKENPNEQGANAPTNPATPVNPGATRTVTGPVEAGGVVPYVEKLPSGGSVRVGRRVAAKKAMVG